MTLKSISCIAACFLLVSSSLSAQSRPSAQQVQQLVSLPLSFEPNRGQTSPEVQWVARGSGYTLFLSGPDAVLQMSHLHAADSPGVHSQPRTPAAAEAVRMTLLGAARSPQTTGEQPQAGKANYFKGTDRNNWQRDVPMFSQVRLAEVYPGVDLTYYGKQGHLEYDFVVAPGADSSAICLRFQGATPVLTSTGDLRLDVAGEQVTLGRPVVFQTVNDVRQPVEASFEISSSHDVTFRLGAYDQTRALTIDPVLLFDGTFGSGARDTVANALTVDAAGEIILTGATHDLAFPTTTGTIQPSCGSASTNYLRCTDVTDAFITKIAADGKSLVFSTYLSGTQYNETGTGIAVDAAGTIYAVGNTDSVDFPITSDAYQKLCSPIGINPVNNIFTGIAAGCGATIVNSSMYLLKINAAGNQILYGTFLGGSQTDEALGVSLDPAGNIYVAGVSSSAFSDYPIDNSINYPTTPSAFQTFGANGNFYATLAKFSNDGHTLLYSTFLGGVVSNPHTIPTDHTYTSSLAVGQNGVAFLGGETFAFNFPTTAGVLKPTCAPVTIATKPWSCGQITGFVSAIDTTKSGTASLVYSTFIGPPSNATGSGDNYALTYVNGLLADSSNDVYVTGNTQAFNFPTTAGAFQTSCPYSSNPMYCNAATYLAKINPTGTAFLFSTFYGGPDPNNDYGSGQSLATDTQGRIYLYGLTRGACTDLPVLNSIQPACSSGNKIFIAAFSPDGSNLLFGTRFGSPVDYEAAFTSSGIALDTAGNIYFGGLTTSASFPTTAGTYAGTRTGGQQRTFFGKISPVLAVDTTKLVISPVTTSTGQPVTFTVTVTGTSQAAPAPTGSVTLTNTGVTPATTIGTIQLGSNGSGTLTSTSLAAGTYQVVATYNADSVYDFSTSSAQPLTINNPAAATVTLTSAATAIKVGSAASFNVSVAGTAGSPTATGTVYFLDGSTMLGSAVLVNGAATYSTTALAVGTHNISVNYGGDTVFGAAASMPQTVTVSAYAAALTFSATPPLALPGATIALNTTISAGAGGPAPTGKVTILDGTTAVASGTISGATVNLTTSALAAGTHVLSASYSGDANYGPSVSASSTVVLRTAAATTTVLTSSGLSANKGAAITFTATIASQVTTGNPSGTVTFYDGTSAIGTGAVASTLAGSGSATLTLSTLAAGTHSITATYGGDTLFLTSTSAAVAQIVAAPGYTVSASPNPLIISRGQSAMTILTFTPSGGFAGTLTSSCGSLPQYVSCVFSPASLPFTGASGPTTSTLTVYTSTTLGMLQPPSQPFPSRPSNGILCALLGLPLSLFGLMGRGKSGRHGKGLPRLLMVAALFCGFGGLTLLSGCAGSSSTPQNAAAGTYAVSVSIASTDGTNQNLNLSIQIQ